MTDWHSGQFQKVAEKAIHVEVTAGQMLFIPEGWYHQVDSLGPIAIAVNFWWPGYDKQLDAVAGTGMEYYCLRRLVMAMTKQRIEASLRLLPSEEKTHKRNRQSAEESPKRQKVEQQENQLNGLEEVGRLVAENDENGICQYLLHMDAQQLMAAFRGAMHHKPMELARVLMQLSPRATYIWTTTLEGRECAEQCEKNNMGEFAESLFEVLLSVDKYSLTSIREKKEAFARDICAMAVKECCGFS